MKNILAPQHEVPVPSPCDGAESYGAEHVFCNAQYVQPRNDGAAAEKLTAVPTTPIRRK